MSRRPATYNLLGRKVTRGPWATISDDLRAADLTDEATGAKCRLLKWTSPGTGSVWVARVESGYAPALGEPRVVPQLDPARTLVRWSMITEREIVAHWICCDAALGEVRS